MKNGLLACALSLLTASAFAQPKEPILRQENGMHQVRLKRVAVDAAGRYVLSCANDKTARLWDANTGRMLRIFRVPVGGTDEGKLYAGSITPDGKFAAVSGYTGDEWDNDFSIYIFNTQSGELVHRIVKLPNVVMELEFSSDGKWLAAGLGSGKGVRIYSSENWAEQKAMTGYGDAVYGLMFTKENGLVTGCSDGRIRLYDSHFELIKEQGDLSGADVMDVALSPDGTLLAVGFDDVTDVEVRDAHTLQLLYKPSLEGGSPGGQFNKLCFSKDGKRLYGAGSSVIIDDKGRRMRALRCWLDAGRGTFTDLAVTRNSILDLKATSDGRVVVGGSYPDLVVVNVGMTILWKQEAGNLDFAGDRDDLKINSSGNSIGFRPKGEAALRFDLDTRTLTEVAVSFASPSVSTGGTSLEDVVGSADPKINGVAVKSSMQRYERSMSADISSNGREVVIGGDWNLYKFDREGKKIWMTALAGTCWGTNISGNDKTILVALSDGTMRWYSMDTGKELLAFYLHSDKKRWVLFTPSGYYDASPGAEDMLGWHINNGADKAPSFFPISRFRETYHRPDIVDAVLETLDEQRAITLANSLNHQSAAAASNVETRLPPVVSITSPVNGSTVRSETVRLNYTLQTPGNAPVKNVKVLVNGRPVALERGIETRPSNKYEVTVSIPAGDCTVTLLAENDNGISPEANLFLHYASPAPAPDAFVRKPKLYVLAVGISQYTNPDYKLNFADKDATAFADMLRTQRGKLYEDVVVKSLLNASATRDNIADGLEWIQRETSQGDMAMIFYAGHGINDNNGIFYMMPVGADVARLRSTCLNFEELRQTVSSIAGKVVVFIDACHSGNVMGTTARRGNTDINSLVNELSSTQNGAVTFTSSTGKEYSLEDPSWAHGAFTKALLEGLSGKASVPGKNKITVKSLDAWISERVKELTGGKQHPTSVVPPNVPDFPIGSN